MPRADSLHARTHVAARDTTALHIPDVRRLVGDTHFAQAKMIIITMMTVIWLHKEAITLVVGGAGRTQSARHPGAQLNALRNMSVRGAVAQFM